MQFSRASGACIVWMQVTCMSTVLHGLYQSLSYTRPLQVLPASFLWGKFSLGDIQTAHLFDEVGCLFQGKQTGSLPLFLLFRTFEHDTRRRISAYGQCAFPAVIPFRYDRSPLSRFGLRFRLQFLVFTQTGAQRTPELWKDLGTPERQAS